MKRRRPISQPPTSWAEGRPARCRGREGGVGDEARSVMVNRAMNPRVGQHGEAEARGRAAGPTRDFAAPSPDRGEIDVDRSVLEALADLVDRVLGHELGARVEIGGGDAAVDLQVELHHRPEALQEGLLPERARERAGADLLLLLGPEVEAEGADLVVDLELRDRRRRARA